jgi:hypothetical protein
MGGTYSVIARNKKDIAWKESIYTDSFLKFLWNAARCFMKYEVVSLGKHGGK